MHALAAEFYWAMRLRSDSGPTTAAACGRWIYRHVHPDDQLALTEEWAVLFGSISAGPVSPKAIEDKVVADLAAEMGDPLAGAYFCYVFELTKFRKVLDCRAIVEHIGDPPLGRILHIYRDRPILRAFAINGASWEDPAVRQAMQEVLADPETTVLAANICLDRDNAVTETDERRQQGVQWARDAAARWPREPLIQYRLAEIERDAGNLTQGLAAPDRELALLPTVRPPLLRTLLSKTYESTRSPLAAHLVVDEPDSEYARATRRQHARQHAVWFRTIGLAACVVLGFGIPHVVDAITQGPVGPTGRSNASLAVLIATLVLPVLIVCAHLLLRHLQGEEPDSTCTRTRLKQARLRRRQSTVGLWTTSLGAGFALVALVLGVVDVITRDPGESMELAFACLTFQVATLVAVLIGCVVSWFLKRYYGASATHPLAETKSCDR
ncbi:hypothetical protein [Crossiella sp. S99.1]|uniref:hypothetical protein n=1 Tax=Crossiella sp. S99.1 TaxID=2936271 RepID=UPI001FFF133D|nr:hypothetical protein [Crossiella sp. S99.1]